MGSKKAMYDKACYSKNKYAVLESDDRQRASGLDFCSLVQTGRPVFTTWVTTGVVKNFKYKRAFNTG